MGPINVEVKCRARMTITIGVGVGVSESAGGRISSRSFDPNRPRNCHGNLFSRRRPHFVIGGSLGQLGHIGFNKNLTYTVPDDNFDCVFEDGDSVTVQGVTILFFKIGRLVYDLKHVKTWKFLLELNIGAEISSIKMRIEGTTS